jgi:hypothetical protein
MREESILSSFRLLQLFVLTGGVPGDESEMIFNLECDGNSNSAEAVNSGGSPYNPNTSTSPSSFQNGGGGLEFTSPSAPSHSTPPTLVRGSGGRSSGTIPIPNSSSVSASSLNSSLGRTPGPGLSSSPVPTKLSLSPHQGLGMIGHQIRNFPVCSIPPLQRTRSFSSKPAVSPLRSEYLISIQMGVVGIPN